MNFLIIGCGLIGKERIKSLLRLKQETNLINNIYVYDPFVDSIPCGTQSANEKSFIDNEPDWVFIATPHNVAYDWISIVSQWKSKILIEKPLGRNLEECKKITSLLKNPNQLFVGFNYRFYKGVDMLYNDILNNKFGEIISINMKLGHGGSPQDRYSWKLNSQLGSPDCLLDPAIHFLDLLNYMYPKRTIPLCGKSWSGFWNNDILEEIHLIMDINNFIVNLQSSLVRWRSTFEIEVNGTNGYGILYGKGRSYGKQTYTTGERWGWFKNNLTQRQSEIIEIEDNCEDSFYLETKSLLEGNNKNCTSEQAIEDMILYDECMKVIK